MENIRNVQLGQSKEIPFSALRRTAAAWNKKLSSRGLLLTPLPFRFAEAAIVKPEDLTTESLVGADGELWF